MNVVRDNPAARWLPSRHRFALARLMALLRFHAADSRPPATDPHVDRLVMPIDRDQSAVEIYTASAWLFATFVWYFAAILPLRAGWAVLIALSLAGIVMQFPMYLAGAVLVPLWNRVAGTKIADNRKLNSFVLMTLMAVASSYFAVSRSSARYAAWLFFAIFLLNAVAWLIMAPQRARVREMERQCGL